MCDYETVEIAKTENGEPFTWDDLTDEQKEELTGADGVAITLEPGNVLITQSDTQVGGSYPLLIADTLLVREVQVDVLAKSVVKVNDGGNPTGNFTIGTPVPSKISGTTDNSCTVVKGDDGKTIGITAIGTHTVDGKTVYVDHGYVDIPVTYKDTLYTLRLNFYCNLLGDWKDGVIGDTKTEIGKSTWFDLDANGNIVESQRLGTFIRSSKENTSRLEESNYFNIFTGVNPSFPVTFALTADDLAKFGTSYRFSLQVESATENLTIQIKRSLAIIKTYTNVNDVLDDILTLSQAGTYTITCSATATIIGIGIYAENTDKYSEISQTVNEIGLVVNDPNTGVAALNIKADSITQKVNQKSNPDLFDKGQGYWVKNLTNYPKADFNKDYPRYYDDDHSVDDIYSPVVSLPAGTYCFSAYVPNGREFDTSANTISLIQGCTVANPSSGSDISASQVGTVSGDTIVVGNSTYYRKYAIFEISGSTSLCSLNLWGGTKNADVVRPKLEAGNIATPWAASSSQIKQTADSISAEIKSGLETTGVYISRGLIKAKSNNFKIYNNSDQETFSVDSSGNLIASGSIKSGAYTENSQTKYANEINGNGSGQLAKGNVSWNINGDITVKGTINATGGSITGTMTVGEGNRKIKIEPNAGSGSSSQARIRGFNASDNTLFELSMLQSYSGSNYYEVGSLYLNAPTFKNDSYKSGNILITGENSLRTIDYGTADYMKTFEMFEGYDDGVCYKIRQVDTDTILKIGIAPNNNQEQAILRAYFAANGASAWPQCSYSNGANDMNKGHVHVMTMADLYYLFTKSFPSQSDPDYYRLQNWAVMITRINGN